MQRRSSKRFNGRVNKAIEKFAEKKYVDLIAQGQQVTNANSPVLLVNVPGQGVTDQNRVGTKIKIRSLNIRMFFNAGTAAGQIDYFRLVIGCWKDYQLTSPSATGVLTNNTVDFWNTMLNRTTLKAKRWIPMVDTRFHLYGDATAGRRTKTFNFKFSGKRLPMKNWEFNASLPNQMYFMIILSDKVTPPYPAYNIFSRATYTDV